MSRGFGRSISPGEAFTNNLGAGAVFGAGAFVVNYIVTYVFVTLDGVETGPVSTWKYVGNILYNAQFVDSKSSGPAGSTTGNALAEPGQSGLTSTIPSFIYQLVPIVVLVVAGVLVAQQAQSRLDTKSGAAAGATLVAGYTVLAILGTFLFKYSISFLGQSTSVAPDLIPAVLLAGIAFPLALGAVGGVLSNEL